MRFLCGAEFFLSFPIRDEFVLQKLKKERVEDGAYLVRWSILDYQRIILAVLSSTEVPFRYLFIENFLLLQYRFSSSP